MSTVSSNRALVGALAACGLVAGCVLDTSLKDSCASDSDCVSGRVCLAHRCESRRGADASTPAGDGPTGETSSDGAELAAPDGATSLLDGADEGAPDMPAMSPEASSTADAAVGDTGAPEASPDAPADLTVPDLSGRATGHPNYAFVTSGTLHAQLASLAAADDLCASAATNGGLPGTYRAWLSDATADARDRLGDARGWVRTDGYPFADTLDDLLAGRILYPLAIDEHGATVDEYSGSPITGTSLIGRVATGMTCGNWTSMFEASQAAAGVTGAGGTLWFTGAQFSCGGTARLLCFGIDKTVPVSAVPAVKGRLAFITRDTWPPGGGVAKADAFCQADAMAAHLPGSFKAVLPTSQASLAQRLLVGLREVWIRPDGVVLTKIDNNSTDSGVLQAAWNVTAAGQYLSDERVAMGVSRVNEQTQATATCDDWTSTANVFVAVSNVLIPQQWLTTNGTWLCSAPSRLYCLADAPAP